MLRKVRQQVSQALNAVNPTENRHEVFTNEEDSFEGLLCPLCMHAFLTPKELQDHFNTHEAQQEVKSEELVPSGSGTNASGGNEYVNEGSFSNPESEINDLKLAVSDEKRYSFELKKELDKLHAVLAKQTNDEVPYLVQQIQLLEAGKSAVAKQLLETEKVLHAANQTNDNLLIQKQEMSAKIKELLNTISSLKSELEKEQLDKSIMRDELLWLRNENEKSVKKVDQLSTQLEQRPSEDDMKVLRQELARSQHMMNDMIQIKGAETSEHLQAIDQLKCQKEDLEEELAQCRSNSMDAVAQLRTELENEKVEKEKLMDRASCAEEKVATLEGLLKKKTSDLECVKEEDRFKLKTVETELLEAKSRNADMEKQFANMEILLKEHKKSIEEKTVIIKNKEETIKKYLKQKAARDGTLAESEQKIEALAAKVGGLQKELTRKQKQYDLLTAKLENQEALLKGETKQLAAESASKMEELEKSVEAMKEFLEKEQKLCGREGDFNQANDAFVHLSGELEKGLRRILEVIQHNDALGKELKVTGEKDVEGGHGNLSVRPPQFDKQILVDEMKRTAEQFAVVKEKEDLLYQSAKNNWETKLLAEEQLLESLQTNVQSLKRAYLECEKECKAKSDYALVLEKSHLEEVEEMHRNQKEKDGIIKSTKAELAQLQKIRSQDEAALAEKQEIIEKNHEQIQNAIDKISAAESKAVALEEKLHEALLSVENAAAEKSCLVSEMALLKTQFEVQFEQASKEKSDLEANVMELTNEKKKFLKGLQEARELLKVKLLDLHYNLETLVQASEKEEEDSIVSVDFLKQEIETAFQWFGTSKNQMEVDIDSLNAFTERLRTENADLEKRLLECREELDAKSLEEEKLRNEFKYSEEMVSKQARELGDLRFRCTDLENISDRLTTLQHYNDELLNRVKELEKNNKLLLDALNKAQSVASEKEVLLQDKIAETVSLTDKNNYLAESVEHLKVENSLLQQKVVDYETKLSNLEEKFSEVENSSVLFKQKLVEKENSLEELNKKLDDVMRNYEVTTTSLKEELNEKKTVIDKLQLEYSEAVEKIDLDNKENVKLKERLAMLEDQIQLQERNEKQMNEKIASLEEVLKNKSYAFKTLETEKTHLENMFSLEVEKSSEFLEREALLIKGNEDLSKQLDFSKTSISQLKDDLSAAEHSILILKDNYEKQITTKNKLLDDLKTEFLEKEDSHNKDMRDKNAEIKKLETSLEKNHFLLRQTNDSCDQLREELQKLNKERDELAKNLSSYNEEKRTLLERCLNTESDLDFERERAAENRRRFEEAFSAMHELGRVNQSLQMDISKQFNRKWLDDTEAVNCNACHKPFSLTFRKHHCRMCGLIFCSGCSSRTATIPSSKNPVRVCNRCFEDLSNR